MKKKIRYSEFAAPQPVPAAPPVAPAPVAAAPVAPATPAAPAAPAVPPVTKVPSRLLTPLSMPAVSARPTPMRGTMTIPRPMVPRQTVAMEASRNLRDRARLRTGRVDVLLFRVGPELFGIELAAVEEAIDLGAVRHVPEMPPAMLGVITVRGGLTAVYSPSEALGLGLASSASSLIFRRGAARLAIAVDDVDDVHTVNLEQLRDAPGTEAADGVLLGVLRHRDSLLALVDAEALILACQAVPVLETA